MTPTAAFHCCKSPETSGQGVAGHFFQFGPSGRCLLDASMCLWPVGRRAGGHLGPSASCFLAGLIGLILMVASESQADEALASSVSLWLAFHR